MTNLRVKNGVGADTYLKAAGAGSDADPAVPEHKESNSAAILAALAGGITTTGGLTDTQLRATALPVVGTVTATGPLTDTQLRATALPVSGSVADAGPAQTVARTYTASADMTTAAAITPAPGSGLKITAMDILVSTDTAMSFIVQEETSATVLARVFLPANGTAQITLRGYLKAAVADKKMMGKASVAGNVAVTAVTFSEA